MTASPVTRGQWMRIASALVLALLSLLPVANWIPGGHADGPVGPIVEGWLAGGTIALLGGILLWIASRRVPALTAAPLGERVVTAWVRHPRAAACVLGALAFLLYAWIGDALFARRPLLIDEIVQVMQARMLAAGRLWAPAGPHPEFSSSMHVIDWGGRTYGQFPVGGPAVLALGSMLGGEWLVMPACGTLSAVLFALLVRRLEPRPGASLLAAILFAFAPFTAFMAGSHMNHVVTLTWLLLAALALAVATDGDAPRPGIALLAGLGLGGAATVRPVDALAFAVPSAAWLLWRAMRDRRQLVPLLASGVGVLIPVAALLAANVATTGAPLRFGYQVMWGPSHDLGFHAAPWGAVHTPLKGLELVSLYLWRLQRYLFEAPLPSLVPALVAMAWPARLGAADRWLLASGALLLGLYGAYWHDGFYLGPRFMYPLAPIAALWVARLPWFVRERFGAATGRALGFVYAMVTVLSVTQLAPLRAREYTLGMLGAKWDADAAADAAGVRDGVVLVRESWGAQVMARMWALGVSRPDAEWLYRSSDTCRLDGAVAALERAGIRDSAARDALLPLVRDSARLVRSPYSSDPTERVVPGSVYGAACQRRIAEDQAGFTVFPPLLLARGGARRWARDLHARDSLLLASLPESTPLWLVAPAGTAPGAPPRFVRLSRDSLRTAWAAEVRDAPDGSAGAAHAP